MALYIGANYHPHDWSRERWKIDIQLMKEAKIKVVLDVSMRPAPVWVHKLCPGCNICDKSGVVQPSIRRYMEDIADPAYQYYALRFAEVLVKRYQKHPALFAFGLCNEIGSGKKSYSEQSRQRFIQWLKKKYGSVEKLNQAWATRRWCRRLTSFDDVVFPENGIAIGSPEAWLDMRRFCRWCRWLYDKIKGNSRTFWRRNPPFI